MTRVLVIGSTGQVGRVVVEEALSRGFTVRAQSRNAARAERSPPAGVEVVEASPVSADDLRPIVRDVDAVVLTHGGDMDGDGSSFYAAIPALLDALGDNDAHISLMTAMNTSHSSGPSHYGFIEWKRRAERLLRVSGRPYTIVRPGWFDYQGPEDQRIDLRQGDLVTGRPGVDRRHIAQVLLEAVTNPSGARRTVEIFSAAGSPVTDFEALFASTRADEAGALDGVLDTNNVPLADEPERVQADVARFSG
ncbi:NAD(P)H-binding protein [Actinomyces sp. ZJ308]|uniref:NAD(P)H-binding protein n=1 Tax=Actinomyces sp. ZJ308 TaxID=2708342 RepID=UPI0014212320|nr:NAD(P)H-binding protein [Actinomyces sp. ZJ308]